MKNILSVFLCLFVTIAINAQADYLASSNDVSLIDFVVEEESVENDMYNFKAGVLHADNDVEKISLTYVEKNENFNYKFTIKNKEGHVFKEFRFIELKKNDISLSLDFSGLEAGPYIVEIERDQTLNLPTIAGTDK